MTKLKARTWASFLLIGLVGQFSWTIENMYLNVYLYNTVTQNTSYIAAMVACSAITATVTTLVMGIVSDKVRHRKPFISVGYLLWGISVVAFGFISTEHLSIAAAAAAIVILDCVMTFFGSTANDAAFNAYVTDVTDGTNRGRVEAVLSTLPLISMLVIFGLFDGMTQQGRWQEFFLIFGLLVSATGLVSLFLLEKRTTPANDSAFFSSIVYGFRPSVWRANAMLYLSLTALCLFSVAVQVFFPYLMIYMQSFLHLDSYPIVLGVVLIVASAVSVFAGRFIDRVGKLRFVLPAGGLMFLGLAAMFFARGAVAVIAAGAVMMSGYLLVQSALSAAVRDCTPPEQAGQFQGIRMVFAVLIPMCTGPYIGSFVIARTGSGATYEDLGAVKQIPTPWIFLAAAAVLLLVLIPVHAMKRRECHADN